MPATERTDGNGTKVLISIFGLLLLLAGATARAGEVNGQVIDENGTPLPGAVVVLEVGRARFVLSDDYDRWLSVTRKEGKTDEEGKFEFKDIPSGAVATASVATKSSFGVATGAGELKVILAPTGSVKGQILGKRSDLGGLRVWVRGGDGFGGEEGKVDKNGIFQVEGIPPGEGKVYVNRNNWTAAEGGVKVEAGKTAIVRGLRVSEAFAKEADPLVDARKALLMDEKNRPVSGVSLVWSTQWMDGSMSSDDKGIVPLVGGAVAIGGPPFRLRLHTLRGDSGRYWGEWKGVSSGCALVVLHSLIKVTGAVKQGDDAVKDFVLVGVSTQHPPRVYRGGKEGDGYSILLPGGKAVLAFGTVDGVVHRREIVVDPAKEACVLDLDLGDK